jgi:hypothetical protein
VILPVSVSSAPASYSFRYLVLDDSLAACPAAWPAAAAESVVIAVSAATTISRGWGQVRVCCRDHKQHNDNHSDEPSDGQPEGPHVFVVPPCAMIRHGLSAADPMRLPRRLPAGHRDETVGNEGIVNSCGSSALA